jgi:hypothetical protein
MIRRLFTRATPPEPPPPLPPERLFESFWIAGYESATHINIHRTRLDIVAAVQHDTQVASDYALLRTVGIQTARDAVRWHLVDRAGRYDFSSLAPFVAAAGQHGIQVLWDLCHYGFPDDVDFFSPQFVSRFAGYCGGVAHFIHEQSDAVPFYTPINEISFFAWSVGDRAVFAPFARGRAADVKRQLVRAAIAGIEAIWAVDRRARIIHVDPIIHVVPPRGRADLMHAAAEQQASQWEAWDMLAGYREPRLGGNPRYLDIVGANFYHDNQWEFGGGRLRWEESPRDARWMPLSRMLAAVWERYHRPLLLSETSHFGVGRAPWLHEVTDELVAARALGVPVAGCCIYPILDRMDWENPNHWHNSGLWDLPPEPDGTLRRVLNEPYAAELRRAQVLLPT